MSFQLDDDDEDTQNETEEGEEEQTLINYVAVELYFVDGPVNQVGKDSLRDLQEELRCVGGCESRRWNHSQGRCARDE